MLRKNLLLLALGTCFIFPNAANAIETLRKGAPAQVGGPIVAPIAAPVAAAGTGVVKPEDPLTVSSVIVDKTAENVIKAKEQAIGDAYRKAFMKLAARNMTPEALKDFQAPDDKTITALVQDFEVQGEKLSSTRYVADYTVRFRSAVREFIPVALPQEVLYEDSAEGEVSTPVENQASVALAASPAKTYLILPYFENTAGKTILWEDDNPWRAAWQSQVPPDAANGSKYMVPMGDISDVSAGPANAVWSGDYKTIEKLRKNYNADEVVLAVANKSGAYMTIDMYFFRDGSSLRKRKILQPYVGERDIAEAFAMARAEVMKFLEKPEDTDRQISKVEAISRELISSSAETAPARTTTAVIAQTTVTTAAVSHGATEIETMMSFNSPSAWMDVQKRLSGLTPPVQVNLRSLSKGGAQFVLKYAGDISSLQRALSAQGLALSQPSVEINSGTEGMKPVYGLSIAN